MNDISREIIQLLNRYGSDRKKAIEENNRLDYLYALSDIRENLLEWYPFHADGTLLQVGADYGAMTGLYSHRCKDVVVLDPSGEQLEVCQMRYQDAANITYIQGELEDYAASGSRDAGDGFDYVVMVGSLKPGDKAQAAAAKSLLKPGGQLIAAVCNRFGMKYWAGAEKDEYNMSRKDVVKLLAGEKPGARKELEFYYPMPDYKLPVSIYSQSYLPGKGDLTGTVPAYDHPEYPLLDIGASFDAVCEDGQFENFANSFLVIWRDHGTN